MIVTSDHGEGLGEHGLYDHGESLYRTEIRVPLVIVPPAAQRIRGVVGQTVSLRDLPATIVELAGQGIGSPFPGRSLSRLWADPNPGGDSVARGLGRIRAIGSQSDQSQSGTVSCSSRAAGRDR